MRDDPLPPDLAASSPVAAPAPLPPVALSLPATTCRACQGVVATDARFCRHCGTDLKPGLAIAEQQERTRRQNLEWSLIRNLVWFYTLYLMTIVPLYSVPDDSLATAMLVVGGIDAVLILTYWHLTQASLGNALRPRQGLAIPTLVGVALLVVLLPINYGYHGALQWWFGIGEGHMHSLTEPFETAGYGLAVQLFCLAVMPAIWEEIAFRGLILDRLERVAGRTEALWLTAALFAIIHAQWLSLPYLFLMGAVLGYLRQRSGSLLPGMALHGLHNALVVVL